MKHPARVCPLCRVVGASREVARSSFDPARINEFSYSSRKTPEAMHHRFVECLGCRLWYVTPSPQVELVAAYREAAFTASTESEFAASTYAGVLARWCAALSSRGAALDIGTGDGAFLAKLLDLGFQEVMGVEPSRAPIAAASPRVRSLIREGLFSEADFSEATLSLVTCFQTLEHVPDPLALLESARRLLRPGGAVVTVCHDRTALPNRVLGTRSPIFDIEHLQLFSPASLRRALALAGFERIELRAVRNRYPLGYWLRLLPLPARARAAAEALVARFGLEAFPLALPVGNLMAVGFRPWRA